MIELPRAVEVAAVTVQGSNHSGMYSVSHAELSGSLDGLLFDEVSAIMPPLAGEAGPGWEIRLPGCGAARFLLVTVWTGPNNFLNLCKIKVYRQ